MTLHCVVLFATAQLLQSSKSSVRRPRLRSDPFRSSGRAMATTTFPEPVSDPEALAALPPHFRDPHLALNLGLLYGIVISAYIFYVVMPRCPEASIRRILMTAPAVLACYVCPLMLFPLPTASRDHLDMVYALAFLVQWFGGLKLSAWAMGYGPVARGVALAPNDTTSDPLMLQKSFFRFALYIILPLNVVAVTPESTPKSPTKSGPNTRLQHATAWGLIRSYLIKTFVQCCLTVLVMDQMLANPKLIGHSRPTVSTGWRYYVHCTCFGAYIANSCAAFMDVPAIFGLVVGRIPVCYGWFHPELSVSFEQFWRRWNGNASNLFRYAIFEPVLDASRFISVCQTKRKVKSDDDHPNGNGNANGAPGAIEPAGAWRWFAMLITFVGSACAHESLSFAMERRWGMEQFTFFVCGGMLTVIEVVITRLAQALLPASVYAALRSAADSYVGRVLRWFVVMATLIYLAAFTLCIPNFRNGVDLRATETLYRSVARRFLSLFGVSLPVRMPWSAAAPSA